MAEPNGKEDSKKFLEENKGKEGVITLASGLQYKVLRNGAGLDHPKVGTPCECHYAGTLIDGTKFDSSYDRGSPSTFAPNQVIKGWTEAMQMMVEGDKWEMYIPGDLAYGPSGRPPKIPGNAALIFTMEIMKIKGATTAKKIEFPEWTEEQLKLWTEKDEAAIQKWRDSRTKSYADGNMRDVHPTQEAFDAWLDKQCLASKNKSLWKRTRPKPEATGGGYSAGASAPPAPAPKLNCKQARELLTKALETFKQPENKEKLMALVKECEGMDPSQAGMAKMMKLMPAVQQMMGSTIQEYGFGPSDLMAVTMQVQAFGAEDPTIATDSAKLMKAVSGDFGDLFD